MGSKVCRDRRYSVEVEGRLGRHEWHQHAVQVTNLSASGCRFVSAQRLFGAYTFLTVSLGRAEGLEAQVRWRIGKTHGISFVRPLPPAVLDHIRLFLSDEPALVAEREPLRA